MALTPMMKQYLEIKENYKDCILFFRLGDFYEMFFDDAIVASREMEVTLTGKNCGEGTGSDPDHPGPRQGKSRGPHPHVRRSVPRR